MNNEALFEEAQKIIAIRAMAENFGVREMSDGLLNMWLELLSKYPHALVKSAICRVIEQYEYKTMPPFAIVKKFIDEIMGISDSALKTQAEAEWGVLIDRFEKVGIYGKPNLHQTTFYVVKLMGGWECACQWQISTFDFKRRDFIQLWVDSHGKIDYMALGADGVAKALAIGEGQRIGATAIGSVIGNILKK